MRPDFRKFFARKNSLRFNRLTLRNGAFEPFWAAIAITATVRFGIDFLFEQPRRRDGSTFAER